MDAIFWTIFYLLLALMIISTIAYAISRFQKKSYRDALEMVHATLCDVRGKDPKEVRLKDTVKWLADNLEEYAGPHIRDREG